METLKVSGMLTVGNECGVKFIMVNKRDKC